VGYSLFCWLCTLKVLSSEMDRAEIHRPRFCESPFKLQRHLVQLLAIGKQSANGAHSSVSGLLLNTYSCWQWRYEHSLNILPIAQWTF
jgi:hypothetical protein